MKTGKINSITTWFRYKPSSQFQAQLSRPWISVWNLRVQKAKCIMGGQQGKQKFFTQRVVRPCHRLPEKLWMHHPWRWSKPRMMSQAAWSSGGQPCPWQGVETIFKIPSNLSYSMILWAVLQKTSRLLYWTRTGTWHMLGSYRFGANKDEYNCFRAKFSCVFELV